MADRSKARSSADDEVDEGDGYFAVRLPDILGDRIMALLADNEWGFRKKAEFVATCIREGLAKYEKPPQRSK